MQTLEMGHPALLKNLKDSLEPLRFRDVPYLLIGTTDDGSECQQFGKIQECLFQTDKTKLITSLRLEIANGHITIRTMGEKKSSIEVDIKSAEPVTKWTLFLRNKIIWNNKGFGFHPIVL